MTRANSDNSTRPETVEFTDRQREVLRLIVAGKTNPEIGEALGISLDGAKWHVSEILAKLNVSTREEAADYWRRERALRRRLGRFGRALVALPGLKVAAGATAFVVVVSGAGGAWVTTRDGLESDGAVVAFRIAPATSTPTTTPTQPPASIQGGRPSGCPTAVSSPNRARLFELMLCPALKYPEVAGFDLGGCNLTDMTPPQGHLDQIDFRGCRLDGAVLDGQTLNSSSFEGVSARGASLRASMAGSIFKAADLTGADLSNAVLQGADFTHTTLLGVDLTNAIIRGAIWKDTTCPDGTNSDANAGTCLGTLWVADYWPGSGPGGWVPPVCSTNGMSLAPGALCPHTAYPAFTGSDPGSCRAPDRDLRDADLRWADLTGCDLSGANLAGADLEGASLVRANLAGADLTGAKLFKTDVTGANLAGVRLDRAIISHTAFEGVNLRGAAVTRTLLRPTYGHTTCPDGSSSDAADGDGQTCNNNR